MFDGKEGEHTFKETLRTILIQEIVKQRHVDKKNIVLKSSATDNVILAGRVNLDERQKQVLRVAIAHTCICATPKLPVNTPILSVQLEELFTIKEEEEEEEVEEEEESQAKPSRVEITVK